MIVPAMIAGVILAAGDSVRMGRPKALLRVGPGGPTFLEQLIGTLRLGGLETLVVVAGAATKAIQDVAARTTPPVRVADNPDPSRGQLSSLKVALGALEADEAEAVLVVPVDHPLVSAETVTRLLDAYGRHRAPIVRPCHGSRHGHPVIFDRTLFAELRAADLSRGARDVIAAHRTAVLDVPVGDEGAFTDIDTPDDYERAFGRPPAL